MGRDRSPPAGPAGRGDGEPATDGGTGADGRGGRANAAPEAPAAAGVATAAPSTVYLVGAGPGDPGLLTRRAWGLLTSADVVLHDALTGEAILEELPPTVEVRDVGKRPPDRTAQATINDLLVERATAGDAVVRLKGGDPTVFGRGGEEAQHLADAAVPFEVVPGISSVVAAPAVAGVPLTHREHASSLTVVTGHETPEKDDSALDWDALASTVSRGGTLVVLMGVGTLADTVVALREHGVEASTPVALVEKATWPGERVVSGTLATIVEDVASAALEPPAVTIVGEVVDVREDVAAWLADAR